MSDPVILRSYQQNAIKAWAQNEYKGFFEMATGTGKTITALYCAKYLLESEGKINLIILVPTLDIAVQWKKDVKEIVCKNVILANSENKDWYQEAIYSLNGQEKSSFCIIATYATFQTERFQYVLYRLSPESMLIADEAHNFGTELHLNLYPKQINRRLGLSATPIRHFDEKGTAAILDYFHASLNPTFQFGISDAIQQGYLCEYYYYPILVSLTEDELGEYKAISKKLIKYFIAEEGFKDNPIATALLLKRKRIIHRASRKFQALREILQELVKRNKELKYVLVYVPEGNGNSENAVDTKLINEYSRIISLEFGLSQHQFIGMTKGRSRLLDQFEKGEISVLTAMKCLDEGVDIGRAETAIFCASTGNPKQFIQRRGRILRTHPEKKNAVIYDMIVVPMLNDGSFEGTLMMERSILRNELKRVYEFASSALNQYQALQSLEQVAKEFDLDIYSKM